MWYVGTLVKKPRGTLLVAFWKAFLAQIIAAKEVHQNSLQPCGV